MSCRGESAACGERDLVRTRAAILIWCVPAALVFLSPSGVVNQYVHGFELDPVVLDKAVVAAGTSEPQATSGFLARCFHQDPDRGAGARTGAKIMRYTGRPSTPPPAPVNGSELQPAKAAEEREP